MNYTIFDMKYVYITVFTLFLILIVNVGSHAQCNLKFEYKVEKSNTGNGFDILIKAVDASGTLKLHLVDLLNQKKGIIEKKDFSASELKEKFVIVFKNVKSSKYTIQVIDNNKCQNSIGGLEGITVGN